ncbi:hypothetical protein F5148DRAFT_240974 [Russula earlei]|uniref:Uncharacterized protein n=1 Tax=Russula earlei TaxID=71964 RepID=A0ACC0U3M5_9AGAM|nr:hypothetical protein F5148DRAFT_240974 [Russula earlei]
MASADLEPVEPQNIRRKSTAAIEWRTIPPTIKVRHKKRPPPITIQCAQPPFRSDHPSLMSALVSSKRSFEQLVWTPGPLSNSTVATTATSASSAAIFTPLTSSAPTSTLFKEFSKGASVGQDPRALYYAIPGFQQSPNGPDEIKVPAWPLPINKLVSQVGRTTLEVVTELEYVPVGNDDLGSYEVPSPPRSPSVYLTLHPWTLPEYLLLLSIKPLDSKNDNMHWNEVASKLNAATRHQSRTAWDCWHRWMVPWCCPEHRSKPRPNTYPHAPGVQHEYKFSDLEGLIGLWTSLSDAKGIPGATSPPAFPAPKTAAVQPRRAGGRAHHPAYPPQSASPNVPIRTLGDSRDYGLAPWFTMSAVNTPVLQRMLESQPERKDDGVPVHLRGRTIPPSRTRVATPNSG